MIFWEPKIQMSVRSHHEDQDKALEGYINHFIVNNIANNLNEKLQAKMYSSHCKRDKPHLVVSHFDQNPC